MKGVKEYAEELFYHIPGLDPDIEVIKVNVQVDHVHMVIVIPLRYAGVRVVQYIKSPLGKALKEKFPFLGKVYFSREGRSRGYCVSEIGGMEEREILSYVEHQEKEDRGPQNPRLVLSGPVVCPFLALKSPFSGSEGLSQG